MRTGALLILALGGCTDDVVNLMGSGVLDSSVSGERDASTDTCGDGVCSAAETVSRCPADCAADPCPVGEEGCRCNANYEFGDDAPVRDDCDPGLLCLPWNHIATVISPTESVHSCVRPCERDDECGPGRSCTSLDLFNSFGTLEICVDDLAEQDEWCGPSRNDVSHVRGVSIRTPDRQVGCRAPAWCAVGHIHGVHVDEGACIQFCGHPNDTPCAGSTPYCNLGLVSRIHDGTTAFRHGICSERQRQLGAWCGTRDPTRAGFTLLCDALPVASTCLEIGRSRGLCATTCDGDHPCESVDDNGPMYCVADLLVEGMGVCMSGGCDLFPETCSGAGFHGVGRVCVPLTDEGDGVCADRRTPSLPPAVANSTGRFVERGGNCEAADLGFTQCPEPTVCVRTEAGAACVVTCDVRQPAMCAVALTEAGLPSGNATCTPMPNSANDGYCGGD